MYLEAQVQNITTTPLTMESVKFEPSLHYTAEDLNDTSRFVLDSNKPVLAVPSCNLLAKSSHRKKLIVLAELREFNWTFSHETL